MATRICTYRHCSKPLQGASRKFCSDECRRREKLFRLGKVSDPSYFLEAQERTCTGCGKGFTPKRARQKYCSIECRERDYDKARQELRNKECKHCGEAFWDDSPKGNRKAHPECSRKAWGHKTDTQRGPDNSPYTEENRRHRVWHGDGGRIDDISTLKKFTQTWWGRVSELIFAAYRPRAKDMNTEHGNRSPYDFEDNEFGRVDVRGSQLRKAPQGRPMWVFNTAGLKESADYAFLVGYADEGQEVQHLWFVPAMSLNDSVMRMAPGSREYKGEEWEVRVDWGLMVANEKLKELRDLSDPERPEHRFAWMDDKTNLTDNAPGHRGRRGEILYRMRYADSEDMNLKHGSGAPFDFKDPDGTKVNVKAGRQMVKPGSRGQLRWSFSRRADESVHRCDVYSCLCLDEKGEVVLHEYRIPATVWGERRTVHIYPGDGTQWSPYRT